jgi:molybdenum cofactor biosynthesis enzyme
LIIFYKKEDEIKLKRNEIKISNKTTELKLKRRPDCTMSMSSAGAVDVEQKHKSRGLSCNTSAIAAIISYGNTCSLLICVCDNVCEF